MKRTLLQVITTAEHTDTEILAFKLAVSHQPYSYDPTLPQCKWLQNIDYLIYSKLASPASSHCITKLWRRSMNYAVPLFGLNLTLKTNQHKLVDMDGLLNLSKLWKWIETNGCLEKGWQHDVYNVAYRKVYLGHSFHLSCTVFRLALCFCRTVWVHVTACRTEAGEAAL